LKNPNFGANGLKNPDFGANGLKNPNFVQENAHFMARNPQISPPTPPFSKNFAQKFSENLTWTLN